MTAPVPQLELVNITKTFPNVRALDRVSIEVHRGEILALMGENGAGKSTLLKVMTGAYQPDEGEIRLSGQPVSVPSPIASRRLGIRGGLSGARHRRRDDRRREFVPRRVAPTSRAAGRLAAP